ncbi:MAG: mannose-6-phosphate isomerase [Ruminococcaceae bacterium]|nr:mannose-6-phosphate isomerase [Oscillospiraceae bacterium]
MSINLKKPVKLSRAGAWRTYFGGSLIEKLHGNENAPDTNFPEEWIMSTVAARNSGREHIVEGLSMVEGSDISLERLIKNNPYECLGKEYVKNHGKTPGVLVKLIDSSERLTIQVHLTKEKAKEVFDSPFGKTECWHIIGGREINGEKPCIYFGFKKGITREKWKEIFDNQDIPKMLDCMHKFEVKEGDTFLIEGGIPHAIGAGCFLVEVQEPTDFTIRTEKTTPGGLCVSDFMCHQGLGFDKMFDLFDYTGYTKEEILEKWYIKQKDETLIGYNHTKMFALDMLFINGEKEICSNNKFSGIYVLDGEGTIDGKNAKKGDQYFLAACCDNFKISGNMKIIRFYGPKEEV